MSYIATSGMAQAQDRLGCRIASRLDHGTADLRHDLSERLRAGREQAVAARKRESASVVRPLQVSASALATVGLGAGAGGPGWWTRLASAVPVVVLAAGLVLVNGLEADRRAAELAEVDAALLTDDLPPAAYADPGFVQFLKSPD